MQLVGFCEVSSGHPIHSIDLRAPTSRADSEIRKRNRQMKCVFSIVPPAHVATDRSFPEYAARHDQLSKSAGKSGFKMRAGSGRTARVCGALIGNFIDTRSRLKAVDRSHSSRSSVHRSDTCRPFYGESGTGRKPKNRVVIGPESSTIFSQSSWTLHSPCYIGRGLSRGHSSRARLARARRRSKRIKGTSGSSFELPTRSSARSFSRSLNHRRLTRGVRRPPRSSRFFSSRV